MNVLIPLPIILPLLAAGVSIVVARSRIAQRAVSLATLLTLVGASVWLLVRADTDSVVTTQAGGWPAPLGITLVVDRLAGIMLVVSSLMLVCVLLFAIGQRGVEVDHSAFHPTYLVLAAGISASFITGDLFNLFVVFEMMLAASYVLITLGGRPAQVRSAMTYVVISLVASTLFITALALIYAATGTVNMADLSERIPELSGGVRAGFSLLLIVVFGVKAGLFPLFFWLPDSYPAAPGPVTAIFAGLLTKVGVYAIIRTQLLLFPLDSRQGTILLVVAGLTMIVGVLGALAQDEMKRILSFHIVGQIGYMIFGLGLFTVAGVTAVVFYMIQTILVKTNLFLVAALVDRRAGSTRLSQVGGLVRTAPVVAAFFALPALSLAGIPPSSGFAGKLALIDAGVSVEEWTIVVVALVTSLLTLYSMTKVWSGVFWGAAEESGSSPVARRDHWWLMMAATGATVLLSIAYVIWAGPIYDLAARTASDLLDPSVYVDAVLGAAMRVNVRLPALLFASTVLWVALWDDISVANVVGGVLVAIIVAWVTPREPSQYKDADFSPFYAVRYVVLLGWKLLESNLRLAWEILTPGVGTHTGIIAVTMESGSDAVVTVVANSITLTPGTMTVEVDRDGPEVTLYVHGMYTRDPESVRRDVLQLEAWALRGFGTVAEAERAEQGLVDHDEAVRPDQPREDS